MGSFFAKETTIEDKGDHVVVLENGVAHKKLRNPPVTILKEILKSHIKLDKDLERKNNLILQEFLANLITTMRTKNEIFDILYQKFYFTGSYYDGLRVSTPDEYDINLVLKLPFPAENLKVEYHSQAPSFVKCKLTLSHTEIENHHYLKRYVKLLRFFDKDGYLLPDSIRIWWQSVVDKVLYDRLVLPTDVRKITPSASGPARTLILEKIHGGQIDIDLVPVIQFNWPIWPNGISTSVVNRINVRSEDRFWFLVPKEYNADGTLSANKTKLLWRLHFPEFEKKLIYDVGCVKSIIKLLKLLRNKEDWKILASYYLKTVLLWMVYETLNSQHWREDKMGCRFLDALETLQLHIKSKNLPYFFCKSFNLINKINADQSQNIANRLQKIIESLKKDPMNYWAVFGVKASL